MLLEIQNCRLGKIRVSLRLKEEAKIAFLECLKFNRAFWPAWEALVNLIGSIEEVFILSVVLCHSLKNY